MVLLRTSGDGLHALATSGRIGSTVATQMQVAMRRNPSPAEIRSWDASLTALSADLVQAGLGGVEVLLKYQLPLSSKRVDVVLAGEHPQNHGPRSGGSSAYVEWVERLLGLTAGGPVRWAGDDRFEVRTAPSPYRLEALLADRLAEHQTARMAAGYCWPWSDPTEDGELVEDVQIGDWSRPWNLKGDCAVGGAPPSALWASDDRGFGQVGCVYTVQGFEYDWNGVLLGPDLVWRTDRWVTVRSANRDPDFRNTKKVDDRDFDLFVRNVYRVLLTRGLLDVYLHSTDEETQAFLESLVARLWAPPAPTARPARFA